jgi:8-oxo-dGTP diphosphatase
MIERPGVGIGVIARRGDEIVLVRRLHHGRGSWSTPGGYLERGESFEAAAARETREETGLALSDIHVVGVTNDRHPDGKHNVTIWLTGTADGDPSVAAPDELDRVAWFPRGALPANLYAPLRSLVDGDSWPSDAGERLGLHAGDRPA